MALREVLESRSYGIDIDGKSYGRRVFQVDASTEAAALAFPGVPLDNDPYPSDQSCLLDKREATPIVGFGVYNVVCDYSSDRSGRYAKFDDKNRIGYFKLYSGIEKGDGMFPAFAKKPVRIAVLGQIRTITTYVPRGVAYLRPTPYMACEVVTPLLNINQLDIIAGQTGKLHLLTANSLYLFAGATITEYEYQEKTRQRVMYKWVRDKGNPTPRPAPDGMFAPTEPREQFEEYYPIYQVDSEAPPLFRKWIPHDDTDLLGWVTLPYIPLF